MAAQELDNLISELTSWCKAKHGRQRELAAMLGVSEQLVSNWLARRKTPTLQHGLQIQQLLKKQGGKVRKTDG
jgi:transcriptional regulator with XRE-family HTH domain